MKRIFSKKIQIRIGVLIVIFFGVFIFLYNQTKIENLFLNTNTSTITYHSMENKMKLSSFLHKYKLESTDNSNLYLYKVDGGLRLEFREKGLQLLNSTSSSQISENEENSHQSGQSFKEIKKMYGNPTHAFKDKNNVVKSASWDTDSNDLVSIYFDDEGNSE